MIRRLSKLEVAIYREELICPTARMSAEIARNVRHTMKCFTNFSIEKLLRNTETTVKTSIDMNDNFQETQPKSHIRMRKRCSFSALQVHFLEVEFAKNRYISSEQRQWLSIFLGLTPQQVKIWFQNRRYKTKLAEPKYQHTLAWCYSTTNTNKETDCTNAYD
ncbi:homeobox domain-containing protein [Ditylenchus destructor]|uniref:Homeobox domain-containing protein n=1 Tax=Ditylenchus destructor TaxID=166010 RepID=A0AAD4RC58_9BILA|nr:homeobox domain-containing protein [Ditylenchus destructor]